MLKLKLKRSGFTVVELLIVIVVIAILAVVTIVAYSGLQKRALETALKSDLRQAHSQLSVHAVENGSYPADINSVKKSETTDFQYTASGHEYCLTGLAAGAGAAFYITHGGSMLDGVCPGHSSVAETTGGVISNIKVGSDSYTVHSFTSSGEFLSSRDRTIEYLIVGGGGGGGSSSNSIRGAGGGGGGGVLTGTTTLSRGQSLSIIVGNGGGAEENGGNSSIGSVVAYGGGAGSHQDLTVDLAVVVTEALVRS